MTETGWLKSQDAEELLPFVSVREDFRRFACACLRARGFGDDESDEHDYGSWNDFLEMAERMADGTASATEVAELVGELNRWVCGVCNISGGLREQEWEVQSRLLNSSFGRQDALSAARWCGYGPKVRALQAKILRDIIGNPFQPVNVNRSWLTTDVLALASEMWESNDFSMMPILADVLQNAGCDNNDILSHCRQPGEHVRGCWVVDVLTGRK